MIYARGPGNTVLLPHLQAFKSYDEAGVPRRVQCLKYVVLAYMLMESKVDPFDAQEARPYKQASALALACPELLGCNMSPSDADQDKQPLGARLIQNPCASDSSHLHQEC
jgi:hypothetical protein